MNVAEIGSVLLLCVEYNNDMPNIYCEFPQIHSIVSKMMMEEAWAGSWDQPTRTVVMHNAEPSQLQMLASDLSDRVSGAHVWQLIWESAHCMGRFEGLPKLRGHSGLLRRQYTIATRVQCCRSCGSQ